MVILEAMANNKPCISMDVGSVSEVIKDGENGFLIKSGDLDNFIKKIIYLKNNKYIIEQLGIKAFKTIKNEYIIDKYVTKLENIYDEVVYEI